MVFVFGSVYVTDYIYRLADIEPALHPRVVQASLHQASLIMVDKLFDVLLDSVPVFC